MRKANKPPSDWLKLLCKDWAMENMELVDATDAKFSDYKPYLKGQLSSQLLCRLSIPPSKESDTPTVDFWGVCGIQDEFDKAYIIAQVERFCALYNVRGTNAFEDGVDAALFDEHAATVAAAAAAANGNLMPYMNDATAAAVAAAAASDVSKLTKKQASEVSKAHRMAKDAEKALEQERRQNLKREQRRLSMERKEQKVREREAVAIRKSTERITRESTREERRRKKLELRLQRDQFANEQKEAALKRAAELVASNRVPIEITRGSAAAKAAATAALQHTIVQQQQNASSPSASKKQRSAIVVSTASDLHQIVSHSKNLWAKYNAIAKEHNQKVNWITVAKELGIHVKVREKYARMHSRAEQRGFDWDKQGHWKIKDHPDIFLEPTQAEQKAKMPPPPPDTSTTVLISDDNKEVPQVATDEAAVAAAAAVVDAAGVSGAPVHTSHDEQTTAAAVAATLVADPTANLAKVEQTQIV
jgi:hypothetical protein